MKQILSDFYKFHFGRTVGYIIVTASAIVGLYMAGIYENEKLRLVGIAVTAFLMLTLLCRCASIYSSAPSRFRKAVDELSDELAEELFSEYPDAKTTAHHRYMSNMVLFYSGSEIKLLCYKDITGIAAKGKDLLLYTKENKEPTLMPCPIEGLCAVAAAYMRDKNPKIKRLSSAD